MEEGKHKSRKDDSVVKEDDSKRSHRGERDKDRSSNGKHRDRDRDKRDREGRRHDRDKSSDSDDRYDREREREREREKRKDKDKEERARARDKKRERDREDRERERRDRVREKERERDRDREREKGRERERERERERDKDRREREREKEIERERGRRVRDREKRREVDSEYSDDDSRERDRKRHRKEDDEYKARDRERSAGKSNRQTEDIEASPRRNSGEDDSDTKDKERKPTHEEEMEDEHKRLDEEMEKRRRRVQEWQELRRKQEEAEREKHGEASANEPKMGKTWTLEGESDDEEGPGTGKSDTAMDVDENEKHVDKEPGDSMVVDGDNGTVASDLQDGTAGAPADEEIDPLDAFMNSMVLPEVEKLHNAVAPSIADKTDDKKPKDRGDEQSHGGQRRKGSNKAIGRIIPGEESDSDYADLEIDGDQIDEDDDEFMKRVKKTKAEKLSIVDHSKIDYNPFKKNFHIEVKEIAKMTPEEVAAYRKQLELKIHGKDVPKPVKSWHQTGLTSKILETIKKLNYEKPMPIQAQALPVIMSGRDCIGIAKTGSGKTLAFVLPMLRHIKDQPPVVAGDGPIGLIMAPTRELVQQIYSDIKKFGKVLGLRCVPVYGGSGVAQQISELKRGAEIVVCTPGRMIDILCTSSGKITNLRRVTYLVMDEADRMFDMGFEPQITRIVQNIRPDRQTVLFSATFPRQVEILARKVLNKPVEIQVGGRSVVNKDITQLVEVRPENERFLRLLEILGEWYEKGKILIFVHSQEKCDALFKDLLRHGYPCLSLHGAKDQTDRESTIADFKSNVCNLLIATSIAARGLDVKELELVINFDVPNHYEDYVHRVGRTGRAGRKGCAITFISEEESRYAPDLLKALELSEQIVPNDLKALADSFMAKVNQGLEQAHGTGYGGSGFKFNEEEDEVRKAAKKAQAKEYGFEEDKSDSEDEDEGIRKAGGDISQHPALAQILAASKVNSPAIPSPISAAQLISNGGLPVSLPAVLGLPTAPVMPGTGLPLAANNGATRAALAAINLQHNLAKIQSEAMPEHYEAELEINDFPQNARWKVTHKETLGPISEWTGAAITTRGQYFPPGKVPGPGDRKLYLFIEGPSEQSVKRAKAELKRVLEDITNQALQLPGGSQPGKYSVV